MNMDNMREKGKISIIMPVYNREKVIKRAIDSCLSQSYPNLEIVVIDDHSTDKTVEIVKAIMQKDERVILKYNLSDKHGANVARNIGLRHSSGEYITFCDSDDYLLQDSLKKRIACLERNDKAVMVYGNAYCETHHKRVLWKYDDIEKYDRRKYLLSELSLCQQNTIMFRANVLNDIGLLDEKLNGWTDDALVLSIGLKYPIVYCDEPVCVVIKSKISMTSNKKNMYLGLKSLVNKYKKEIISEAGLKRYILWKIRILNNWLHYKQQDREKILLSECFENLHDLLTKKIKPYFNHYFE